mgnify:CR=1 FL=1
MRNVKQSIILALLISLTSAFANAKYHIYREKAKAIEVSKRKVILSVVEISKTELLQVKVPRRGLDHFLHDIGMRESSNRYHIKNKWGYLGKYQFGRRTLDQIGFKKVSNERFLRSPRIQEQAMRTLLKHNRHVLRRTIKKYNNTFVSGILVTESGILAGAHLAGPRAVKRFLRGGKDKRDGLGTPVSSYIKKFSGYNLQTLN